MGFTARMLPGVRPIICLASTPTATTALVDVSIDTPDGSLSKMLRPRAYTSVFAVPRSTARSLPSTVTPRCPRESRASGVNATSRTPFRLGSCLAIVWLLRLLTRLRRAVQRLLLGSVRRCRYYISARHPERGRVLVGVLQPAQQFRAQRITLAERIEHRQAGDRHRVAAREIEVVLRRG